MKRFYILIFCFIPFLSLGQTKVIAGKILDDEGNSLVGATVIEKGNSGNGVITDYNGEFILTITEASNEIEISYVGFESQTVVITGDYTTVSLKTDANRLQTVEVEGFSPVSSRARIRVQSIQRLPETTVAMTGESLEINGIDNIQTFTSQISNVTFNQAQQPGVNFLTVRGISQIRNAESPVAIVIDGMTLPDASAMNLSLYDIDLLEFVKGPQGTLYGKNAIAGAINIITKDPTNFNTTKIMGRTGNGGLIGGGLLSSGAIVNDEFYYSIAGNFETFDGLINNTFLNEKVDFYDEWNGRGKLKYRFNPRWSATYVQDNFNVKAGGNYYVTKMDIFDSSIPVLADDNLSNEPFGDVQGDSELSNSLSSLKIEGNLSKFRFQSVTSFNATRRYYIGENDYSQYAFSKVAQTSNSDTFSQEFRLTSNNSEDQKIGYTFGTLFQNSKRYLNTSTFLNSTYYDGGFIDASAENANYSDVPLVGNNDDNTIRTFAAFAFFDFYLTDKLTVSAGIRVDNDKLTNDSRITNTSIENDITVAQPKFSIAYAATDNVLAYGNYGRGYRAGGFNSETTVKFDKTYEAEFTDNFEIGLKTSFLNDRIIFNNAAYYISFENQQQYTFIPLTPSLLGIYNLKESTISGFESELKFRATKSLDFFASVGFNNGEIQEGTYNLLTNAAAFDYNTHDDVNVSGNTSPFTVKSTFQIGANAYINFSETSGATIHVNADTRGTLYWDPLEEYQQKPYTLVNARTEFTFSKMGVTIWANNIFDTAFNQEFFPTAEFGFNNLRFPNTPTTVGLGLSYTF
ncbi:MAG: TonB-dependent receptor [Ekhidna sp.]|nr:TonB-dependent receptor [Ekhidna sp.]